MTSLTRYWPAIARSSGAVPAKAMVMKTAVSTSWPMSVLPQLRSHSRSPPSRVRFSRKKPQNVEMLAEQVSCPAARQDPRRRAQHGRERRLMRPESRGGQVDGELEEGDRERHGGKAEIDHEAGERAAEQLADRAQQHEAQHVADDGGRGGEAQRQGDELGAGGVAGDDQAGMDGQQHDVDPEVPVGECDRRGLDHRFPFAPVMPRPRGVVESGEKSPPAVATLSPARRRIRVPPWTRLIR